MKKVTGLGVIAVVSTLLGVNLWLCATVVGPLRDVEPFDHRSTDRTQLLRDDCVPLLPARGQSGPCLSLRVTDLIAAGDKVSVSFHDMGGTLHASEVRVTAKATK